MSGDTAVPTPRPTERTLGNYATSELNPEQMQRAAALEIARDALKTAGKIFASDSLSHWTVKDLLTVADWVLGTPFVTELADAMITPIDPPEPDYGRDPLSSGFPNP